VSGLIRKPWLERAAFERVAGARTRSALTTTGGTLAGAACAFIAAIIAARILPADEFAQFGIGLAVHSLCVQLADLGLGLIAVAETAGDWELGGRRDSYQKLRRLAVLRLASALVVGALVVLLVHVVPPLGEYQTAALIGAGGAVLWSMALFVVSALQAARRFRAGASVLVSIGGLRLALIATCAVAGFAGQAPLLAYAIAAPLVGLVVAAVLLALRRPGEEPPEERPAKARFNRAVAVAGVAGAALYNADILLLSLFATEGEIAIYAAAWRVAAGLSLVNTAIAQALLPYTVVSGDPWHEARRLARIGLTLSVAWLLLVPLFTFAGVAVLGSAGEGTAGPMAILLVAFAFDGFTFTVYQIYLRIDRARVLAVANVAQLVIMVVVLVGLLIVDRGLGAYAPAIGQLVARVAGIAVYGLPMLWARLGRLDWFEVSEPPRAEQVAPAERARPG